MVAKAVLGVSPVLMMPFSSADTVICTLRVKKNSVTSKRCQTKKGETPKNDLL
jgi:hypothetical protein